MNADQAVAGIARHLNGLERRIRALEGVESKVLPAGYSWSMTPSGDLVVRRSVDGVECVVVPGGEDVQ